MRRQREQSFLKLTCINDASDTEPRVAKSESPQLFHLKCVVVSRHCGRGCTVTNEQDEEEARVPFISPQ